MLRDDPGVSFSDGRVTIRIRRLVKKRSGSLGWQKPREALDGGRGCLTPGATRVCGSRRRHAHRSDFRISPFHSSPVSPAYEPLLHTFCGSDIPPLPHGSVQLVPSTVRYTVHVSTSKLAEPTRPAVEVFLFNFTTTV